MAHRRVRWGVQAVVGAVACCEWLVVTLADVGFSKDVGQHGALHSQVGTGVVL
jgi:hypothetical protein